jgi:hypothetical protein
MKASLILSICYLTLCATANSQSEKKSLEYQNFGCFTRLDKGINEFADSLNYWSKVNPLPKYISEPNFDFAFSAQVYECVKKPEHFSFRRAILNRVFNEDVLIEIVDSKNTNFDKLYDPKAMENKYKESIHTPNFPELPYMKYTTRDLAKQRLKELREKKKSFHR